MRGMLAVRPPPEARRRPPPTVLEDLNQASAAALRESAELFAELANAEKAATPVDARLLASWKKRARTINKHVSRSTRFAWAELDRMKIESRAAVIAAKHDNLDERANSARVIEKIRTYSNTAEGSVDRAVAATMVASNLLAQLCSAPETTYHGAHGLHRDVETNADSLDQVFLT